MLPAPSQVGSAAVKRYPNILSSLSALALLPIISFLFSESLLKLQFLIVIDGASRKGTGGHGSDGAGRGARGQAAPMGPHWRWWQAWVRARGGGGGGRHRGGCGCPFSCWQLSVPVSCPRLALSLTKGKQKGESEKEFLIREGSYRLSASLAPERYGSSMLCCSPVGISPRYPQPHGDVMGGPGHSTPCPAALQAPLSTCSPPRLHLHPHLSAHHFAPLIKHTGDPPGNREPFALLWGYHGFTSSLSRRSAG